MDEEIVVVILGGVLTNVYATNGELHVQVIDLDNTPDVDVDAQVVGLKEVY